MPIDALSILCAQLTRNLLAIAKFLFTWSYSTCKFLPVYQIHIMRYGTITSLYLCALKGLYFIVVITVVIIIIIIIIIIIPVIYLFKTSKTPLRYDTNWTRH